MKIVLKTLGHLNSLRFRWSIPVSDVVIVDEISYRLIFLLDQKVSIFKQPIRTPKYWITPKLLYYFLKTKSDFSKSTKLNFQSIYVYALCKTLKCKLALTCADYNNWDDLITREESEIRLICFQLGLRDGTEYKKNFDTFVCWGNAVSNSIKIKNLQPLGSLSLAIHEIKQSSRDKSKNIDILSISILRMANINAKSIDSINVVNSMGKIFELSSIFKKTHDSKIAVACNTKILAPWYSVKAREEQYDTVMNFEMNLIKESFPEGVDSLFFRSPVNNQLNTYDGLNDSRLIIGFFTSVLFEAVGIGCRVLFFHHAVGEPYVTLMKSFEKYIPEQLNMYSFDYSEFEPKVQSLLTMSDETYLALITEFKSRFISQNSDYLAISRRLISNLLDTQSRISG